MSDSESTTQDELLIEVYRSTLPEIYGYLLRRVGGQRVDAEELTQETYMAYVSALRNGEEIAHPPAWLQIVARNKLVDHLRRKGRANHYLHRSEPADPVIHPSRTEAESILHQLPASQRTAMILRYLDDLPVAQVAATMDRSLRSTESLLSRARRTLAAALEGDLR